MDCKLKPSLRSAIPPEAAALYAALHRRDPTRDLLAIGDQEWDRLLRFSDLAHLTLPLARVESLKLPAWVRDRLDKNLSDNQERFRLVRDTYLEADHCLQKAGVEYVVIKGFTLSPDFVELPWLRQQSDLDFYCGIDQMDLAQEALISLGYHPNTTVDFRRADHSPTLYRLGNWTWAGNAFDPEMPLSIELHFSLWNEKVTLMRDHGIGDFYGRRKIRKIQGMKVPVLQDVDILGHLSMHILRDLLAYGTPIHHVYELAEFLDSKAHLTEFWRAWQTQHSDGLRAKEVIAFELARRCFGCQVPDAAEEVLGKLPREQRLWLTQFGHIPLEIPFRESKDAVWLHWSLLNQAGDRRTLIRRAFFPNRLPDPDFEPVLLNKRMSREGRNKTFLNVLAYVCRRAVVYSRLNLRTISHGAMWLVRGSGVL